VTFVEEKMADQTNENGSLLDLYLSSPNLDKKDIVGMAVDLLLAGMDTVRYFDIFSIKTCSLHVVMIQLFTGNLYILLQPVSYSQ